LNESLPIHDLFIRPITANRAESETRWEALKYEDHLLRRFGMAEVLRIEADLQPYLRVRSVADEVWALIEGRVEFRWHDLRTDSPTHDEECRRTCGDPTLVLAPFGVAFGFRPLGESALLLRFSTHVDGTHEGDQRLPWETSG
jgi:hypothetical protein